MDRVYTFDKSDSSNLRDLTLDGIEGVFAVGADKG